MKRCNGYHCDLFFWYPSQPGVKLQMLLSSQQLISSIKLGTIAQVLVHVPHFCSYAGGKEHLTMRVINVGEPRSKDYVECLGKTENMTAKPQ